MGVVYALACRDHFERLDLAGVSTLYSVVLDATHSQVVPKDIGRVFLKHYDPLPWKRTRRSRARDRRLAALAQAFRDRHDGCRVYSLCDLSDALWRCLPEDLARFAESEAPPKCKDIRIRHDDQFAQLEELAEVEEGPGFIEGIGQLAPMRSAWREKIPDAQREARAAAKRKVKKGRDLVKEMATMEMRPRVPERLAALTPR